MTIERGEGAVLPLFFLEENHQVVKKISGSGPGVIMAVKALCLLTYAAFFYFAAGLSLRLLCRLSIPYGRSGLAYSSGRRPLRVAGDLLFFTSLLRASPVLWLLTICLHYSLLALLLDHLRYFISPPVPPWLISVHYAAPAAGAVMMVSLLALLARRFAFVHHVYISRREDYLILVLLLVTGGSGLYLRYCMPVDQMAVKDFMLHLLRLSSPEQAPDVTFPTSAFTAHLLPALLLLCLLPSGKLMHGLAILLMLIPEAARSLTGRYGLSLQVRWDERPVRYALLTVSLLAFITAGAAIAIGRSPFREPVAMPARNGTGPYALMIEKKRDLAPLYHNPQQYWRLWHGAGLSGGDYSESECMRCHTAANHCNLCHQYLGVNER
jgi:nitrate reductase gamma subunit